MRFNENIINLYVITHKTVEYHSNTEESHMRRLISEVNEALAF